MNPHDWYLSLLLRLDRLKAAVNALKAFHASRTDSEARTALSKANRILSRQVQAEISGDALIAEARAPSHGIASDPSEEWLSVSKNQDYTLAGELTVSLPQMEWDERQEQEFKTLAGFEAMGDLSTQDERRLNHLADLRRGLRNARSGQEVIREYEQGRVTRELVKALQEYVRFHRTTR